MQCFFCCLLPSSAKIFLSLRRKEEIKFSRSSICFLLLLQPKKEASKIRVFCRLLPALLRGAVEASGLGAQLRLSLEICNSELLRVGTGTGPGAQSGSRASYEKNGLAEICI